MQEPQRGEAWVMAKYALFQLPELLLAGVALFAFMHWFGLSERIAGLLLVLWVLKDIALYPRLRVAYQSGGGEMEERLLGATGVSRERLDPVGYVTVGSESWRAEVAPEHAPVDRGERVYVRGVRDLTLLVEPDRTEAD